MATVHVVQVGDTMQRIAREHGFPNWQKVYEHADNAALRKLRPNPSLLQAGDQVFIPDVTQHEVELATNARHTFVIRGEHAPLKLRLQDAIGEALPVMRYRLEVGDLRVEGTLPADGMIEHDVPVLAREGVLTLFVPHSEGEQDADATDARVEVEGLRYALQIGALDPVDSHRGLHARLVSLALYQGDTDADANASTQLAINDLTGSTSHSIDSNARDTVRRSFGA